MLDRRLPRLLPFALSLAMALPACENATTSERLTGAPALSHSPGMTALVETASPSDSSTVVLVIGPQGGVIRNGEHRLSVPAFAVSEDTEFTFAMVSGDYIIADLSARQVSDNAPVTTFAHPITLRLSYRGAFAGDPHALRITYLVDGTVQGRREPQVSSVNPGRKTVSSLLTHFSKYAMEIN